MKLRQYDIIIGLLCLIIYNQRQIGYQIWGVGACIFFCFSIILFFIEKFPGER